MPAVRAGDLPSASLSLTIDLTHSRARKFLELGSTADSGSASNGFGMVVDFAVDNHTGPRLSDAEVADLRRSVHEGDLTPVLKAYEKDMQSPFMGTVRGNLIRTLLIQVQKTKVDVEVALGGIDSMLKSQELVFG